MLMRYWMLAVVTLVFIAGSSVADPIEIGAVAPVWNELPGADGQNHSLTDLAKAKVVVVAFTCNHCPVAEAYENRFQEFAKSYGDKGVAFVAINVNNLDEDKLPAMIERAKEKGFTFPYLYDESQKIGHDFGAIKTPHLFVLDSDRKVAFIGAFDDKMDADAVTKHYVADAVNELLAGKSVTVNRTPAHGCGIKYE